MTEIFDNLTSQFLWNEGRKGEREGVRKEGGRKDRKKVRNEGGRQRELVLFKNDLEVSLRTT